MAKISSPTQDGSTEEMVTLAGRHRPAGRSGDIALRAAVARAAPGPASSRRAGRPDPSEADGQARGELRLVEALAAAAPHVGSELVGQVDPVGAALEPQSEPLGEP
jgi:hypothetical protein